MTSGVLIQVFFNLILLAGVVFLWVKMHRPQKDDPRLSRGLQLLQSKIAVLEDLSDQVETQVQQITALMESKAKEIQNQIHAGDKQIQKIEVSMGKSMEVAKIFQDRIPHQEIIERQNTMKYVKAARLAHQGLAVEEISEQVDLSRGEIELIAKVNRDNLQFSEEDLPEWAKEDSAEAAASANASVAKIEAGDAEETATLFEAQPLTRVQDKADFSLSSLGEKFRQAVPREAANVTPKGASTPVIEMPGGAGGGLGSVSIASKATSGLGKVTVASTAAPAPVKERAQTTTGKNVEIQKVVFPRLDITQHLS